MNEENALNKKSVYSQSPCTYSDLPFTSVRVIVVGQVIVRF